MVGDGKLSTIIQVIQIRKQESFMLGAVACRQGTGDYRAGAVVKHSTKDLRLTPRPSSRMRSRSAVES